MKKSVKQTLQIVIFATIGIVLFILVYRDLDIQKISEALQNANYTWIAISLILGLISHISRAMRWVLLIEPMGYKPKTINAFFSVMIMYVSNMAIPRSGEFVRCSVMGKYEKVPFSKLLGTVITERVFDFIMLFAMLTVVLIYSITDFETLIKNNPGVYNKFENFIHSNYVWGAVGAIILTAIGLIIFRKKIKKSIIGKKVIDFISNMSEGIKTVWYMKKKLAFIFHTILIWMLYFLMIYVTFFAFEFTSHLSMMQGLMVFVASSFGMVFPSPGGIGSWHFMAMQSLLLYGISDFEQSGAFAFAAHGSMTLMLIVIGVISFILIPLVNKKIIHNSKTSLN